MAHRAEDTRKKFYHGNNFHKKYYHIKGLDDAIENDSDSESDYDEDSDYISKMVKREDSDSIDDRSEVDLYENQYDVLIEDLNEGEETKYPCLGRGHRIKTQTTTNYIPS